MGKGIPFLEAREKNHFLRVDADEWDKAIAWHESEGAV
jgi:transketolase